MENRKIVIKTVGFLFVILGLSGLIVFFHDFSGTAVEKFTLSSFVFKRVPFITSGLLLLSGVGLINFWLWAQRLVIISSCLYLLHGVFLLHFIWTFHPWTAPTPAERLKEMIAPFVVWVILPVIVLIFFSLPSIKDCFSKISAHKA